MLRRSARASAEACELLGNNPLPNLFRVTPRDPDKIDAIVDRLAPVNPKTGKREPQIAAVDEVRNRRDETNDTVSSIVPSISNDTIPPKPVICRRATSWPGWSPNPGK